MPEAVDIAWQWSALLDMRSLEDQWKERHGRNAEKERKEEEKRGEREERKRKGEKGKK